MKKSEFDVSEARKKVGELRRQIDAWRDQPEFPPLKDGNQEPWYGAHVDLTDDPLVKPGGPLHTHLLVFSRHARALSWVFFQARDIYRGFLHFNNKYEFFGRLGEAANRHLAENQPEPDHWHPLLSATLRELERTAAEIEADPEWNVQSNINLISTNAEGVRTRIPLDPKPPRKNSKRKENDHEQQ